MSWKTIDSAPKDGTRVLGYGPSSTGDYYIQTVYYWKDDWPIRWMHGYSRPTHWQPLPEPPKAAT
jgi:hypothetical protein